MRIDVYLPYGVHYGCLAVIVSQVGSWVQTVEFVIVVSDDLTDLWPLGFVKEFIEAGKFEDILFSVHHEHHKRKFMEELTAAIG